MTKFFKLLAGALIALFAIGSLSACSSEKIDMSAITQVIDVRTPAEFATGHLQGAVNLELNSPDFYSALQSMDKSANYVIYCHSGNRAGQAIDYMKSNGFTGNLTNAKGVDSASEATGLAIVLN